MTTAATINEATVEIKRRKDGDGKYQYGITLNWTDDARWADPVVKVEIGTIHRDLEDSSTWVAVLGGQDIDVIEVGRHKDVHEIKDLAIAGIRDNFNLFQSTKPADPESDADAPLSTDPDLSPASGYDGEDEEDAGAEDLDDEDLDEADDGEDAGYVAEPEPNESDSVPAPAPAPEPVAPRYCLCDCGAEVKPKRNFQQGHDAKVKGIISRLTSGDKVRDTDVVPAALLERVKADAEFVLAKEYTAAKIIALAA